MLALVVLCLCAAAHARTAPILAWSSVDRSVDAAGSVPVVLV